MHGVQHATLLICLISAIIVLPVIYYIKKARKLKELFVRKIAGIDAINESIGRSVELGRPISFTNGISGLGPVLYACLGVLSHIAKRAAIFKQKLIVPQQDPEVLAVVEDTVKTAYESAGRSAQFDPNCVQYLSNEQFAYAAGYIGLVQREKVGAAFLFGEFAAESLILAEAGNQVGAVQVGATTSPEQVAFFISACDYTLIGEELYAASAYLTKEPVQLGSLYGQDRAKLFVMLLIIIGALLATWQSISPDGIIKDFDFRHFWNYF